MASWYQDDSIGLFQRPKSGGTSRPSSATSARISAPVPQPPPINANLLSTEMFLQTWVSETIQSNHLGTKRPSLMLVFVLPIKKKIFFIKIKIMKRP
jgi:hypothetical protein